MFEHLPKFIALEGIDGSGTTTQLSRVAERLRARGHAVCETREPSVGRIGKMIRELLTVHPGEKRTVDSHCLALLFAADRLEHLNREIKPALARGEIVLCDRYVLSSLVYQSLDCDSEWIGIINQEAQWPDMTFVLDLDAELAVERVDARRGRTGDPEERFDAIETQRRVAEGYRTEIGPYPKLTYEDSGLIEIDASKDIDAVTESIMGHLLNVGF